MPREYARPRHGQVAQPIERASLAPGRSTARRRSEVKVVRSPGVSSRSATPSTSRAPVAPAGLDHAPALRAQTSAPASLGLLLDHNATEVPGDVLQLRRLDPDFAERDGGGHGEVLHRRSRFVGGVAAEEVNGFRNFKCDAESRDVGRAAAGVRLVPAHQVARRRALNGQVTSLPRAISSGSHVSHSYSISRVSDLLRSVRVSQVLRVSLGSNHSRWLHITPG